MKLSLLFLMVLATLGQAGNPEYFVPAHRVSGIGVGRDDLSQDLLDVRTDLMIQTQTFSIMRESLALPAAKRMTSNAKLQALFRTSAERSGLPPSLIEAIAYLESWGDPKAQSPAGPRGIMQISQATAVSMGLKVIWTTRYRSARERVLVKNKKTGKTTHRAVGRRIPYKVMVRDDCMVPARAIPAAA